MDLSKGIFTPTLIVIFMFSGSCFSNLYLVPESNQLGKFTGESFFVTCFTTEENIDQLRWTDEHENPIKGTEGRVHVQPAEGDQQGLRLVFSDVEKDDEGTYTCSDEQYSTSFEVVVTRSISFGDTPREQHAPEGDHGIVLCNVKSDGHPVVSWYFKDQQIKDSEKYEISPENHSLKIFNLTKNDAGNYKCKALLITALGVSPNEIDIRLHVQYSPEIVGEPRTSYFAQMGTVIQLPCTVTAEPNPMFQWLRDEMIIYNGTNGYMIFDTNNSTALQLNFEGETQLGDYICRASNALGEEEVIVTLKEGGPPHPPTLSVIGEDQGTLILDIQPSKDDEQEEDLKTTEIKVEYILATQDWDDAVTEEFKIGEPYLLKNMSFNSDYLIRAASHNLAGYGEFSEVLSYKTHALQVALVVSSSAYGIVESTLVLFTSIVFFRLF